MPNTRGELIDLINRSACVKYGGEFGDEIIQEDIDISDEEIERIADYLISNGVVVGKPLEEYLHPVLRYEGLKSKYLVFNAASGKKVENCFVLTPEKDIAAVEALRAYANSTDNKTLSNDIYNWVGEGNPVQKWIPVSERLPETSQRVIVCRKDGRVEQGVFMGVNGWWKVYGTSTKAITHWMPMPAPPEEVGK